MSFKDLLDKTMTVKRLVKGTAKTEYGQLIDTESIVYTDKPCSVQRVTDEDYLAAYGGGDSDSGLFVVFVESDVLLKDGDKITFTPTPIELSALGGSSYRMTVVGIEDAGGRRHHFEVICRFSQGV